MAAETFSVPLTPRLAEALRTLAAREELPPEIYAAEVLTKHLYHAYAGPARGSAAAAEPTPPPSR